MRFHEIINELGVAMKGGHTVFTDPWNAEEEAKPRSVYMQAYTDRKTGEFLYPELASLKLPNGMYDLNKITPQFIEQLMTKYPQSGSPFWGINMMRNSSDPYKYRNEVQDRLVNALKSENDFAGPKSRFFYPNRPEATDSLQGFRGTAKGVENTAKKFDPADIRFYMSAYKLGVSRRILDPISSSEWLMILLTEGRDDFGFNEGQWRSQMGAGERQFDAQMEQMGITNPTQRSFIGLIRSKQALVKRTGISFYQAWNGGAANLGNYNAQAAAVKDPRNKPLLDLISAAVA